MFINKYIPCAIVGYVSMLGLVPPCADAGELSADQFVGKWYTIAWIHPLDDEVPLRCDQREVTKGDSDDTFNLVDSAVALDGKHSYKGTGLLKDSELCVKYPEFGADYEEIHPFDVFNNGEELIYHDKSDPMNLALHSRKTTASDEAKEAFEKEAAKVNKKVKYIDQNNCD